MKIWPVDGKVNRWRSRWQMPWSSPGDSPGDGLTERRGPARGRAERAARERQQQALNLQRENILSQRTSNPDAAPRWRPHWPRSKRRFEAHRDRRARCSARDRWQLRTLAFCASTPPIRLAVEEQRVGLVHRGQRHARDVHMRRPRHRPHNRIGNIFGGQRRDALVDLGGAARRRRGSAPG